MTVHAEGVPDLIVDAARSAVCRIAPEELVVFDEMAAGWRKRIPSDRDRWSVPGGSIGFGVDTTMLGELVLQAISNAVGEVFVLGAGVVGTGWLRRRRRNLGKGTAATAADPATAGEPATAEAITAGATSAGPATTEGTAAPATSGGPATGVATGTGTTGPATAAEGLGTGGGAAPPPSAALVPPPEQAVRLREACYRHALAVGLSAEQAEMLADAAVGALYGPPVAG